ncbi:endonuclease domain-containing 1 protein [Fundulus heteroclitus]|uniref:endonuclease domain-containing 1 protein n=1 Tax=Fundulus heteroclitus TaxID=8078 RepID=UPI00165A3310|nr:endonuclease domain-containing 1 protein [Fundulus heteroclitus]
MISQRNMDWVSAAAFLFLLSCFLGTASGLLSNDFSECKEFFYDDIPPQGIAVKDSQPICQKYKNKMRFATLYDRKHLVALYSAYIVSLPEENKKLKDEVWMYEPQLTDANGQQEMHPLELKDQFNEQASLQDYRESSFYTKGHLVPKQHQGTLEDKEATYTLTNIVPQREGSNAETWSKLESEILKRKKSCDGNMYVITGAIPFKTEDKIPDSIRKANDKVYAPEYIWSAYCCPDFKKDLKEEDKKLFPTYAAVGRNYPDSNNDIVRKESEKGYDVKQMPLRDLEAILKQRLNKEITLFHKHCRAN